MLKAAVAVCLVLGARAFLLDSVPSILGSIINGGPVPHTVTELEDAKYLGRWYQVYASKSVSLTFERNAFCVTADYGVGDNGQITVLNSDRLESATGPLDVIHGYATKTGTVGQLSVHLETVPIAAPYWVIKLGPPTYGPNGLYQYSVVTDNLKATLFVLARNVTTFYNDYDAEVTQFLKEQGFSSSLNKPVQTVHNDQCIYNDAHQ